MLRLAARAPCRSGPVTSTLGSTTRSDEVLGKSRQQPVAAPAPLGKSSPALCRRAVASPAKRLAPSRTWSWRRSSPPLLGQAAWPVSRRLSICLRFQSSPTAAQPSRNQPASPRPCRLRGSRPYCEGLRVVARSHLSAPQFLHCRSACQRRRALPNMSVNRSLHGMAPWPRSARCSCCASRPGRHAAPARLPLR